MARTVSDKGQELLNQLHPHFTQDPNIQGVLDVCGREIARIEAKTDDVRSSLQANGSYLNAWEKTFSVPVSTTDTLEQRKARLQLYFKRLSDSTSGMTWQDRLTELIGANWSYRDSASNELGVERYQFLSSNELSSWTVNALGGSFVSSVSDLSADSGLVVPPLKEYFITRPTTKRYTDVALTARLTVGKAISRTHLILKKISDGTYLSCYLSHDSSVMRIAKMNANGYNTTTTYASTTYSGLTEGQSIWVKARIVGNAVNFDMYSVDPSKVASPTAIFSTSTTLTGADATAYGSGVSGTYGISQVNTVTPAIYPNQSGWKITDLMLADWTTASNANYTVKIVVPFASGSNNAGIVAAIARDITPAHLNLVVDYSSGFILGTSTLGQSL